MTSHSCDILCNDPITFPHDTKALSSHHLDNGADSHAHETHNTGDTRKGSRVLAAAVARGYLQ